MTSLAPVLDRVDMVALPRLNSAGFCRECLRLGCVDPVCVQRWSLFSWRRCGMCEGSGYADIARGTERAGLRCEDCTDGLVEASTSPTAAGRW